MAGKGVGFLPARPLLCIEGKRKAAAGRGPSPLTRKRARLFCFGSHEETQNRNYRPHTLCILGGGRRLDGVGGGEQQALWPAAAARSVREVAVVTMQSEMI